MKCSRGVVLVWLQLRRKSNYILLEKFTENRKAETWKKELEDRLDGFNVEVSQIVSDLCGAIRACTKTLGAKHIPELFHAQRGNQQSNFCTTSISRKKR